MMLQYSLSILDATEEFELYSAQNGLDGIYKALFTQPHLIISDIEMPEMDGLTMAQLFYILGKSFPILFLSAKDDDKIMKKIQSLDGVVGFLSKDIVKDKKAFLESIQWNLHLAETMKQSSEQAYIEGSLEKLAKTGTHKGVLDSGSVFISGSMQKQFSQQHSKGLGSLWNKSR